MSNNFIDELFDNLRRDPFTNNPTNDTSYELQKDFLSDPQGPEGWIADGVITDVELADGSTTITNVTSLPTLPLDAYPVGKVVYLTTDGKLYRNIAGAWSAAVAAVNLTGQITDTQITDSAITTQKIAANAIVADKIAADAITSDKIIANAITTGKIAAGSITAASGIIASINADTITTGTISAISVRASTIKNDPSGVGLLIQGSGTGVDAGFGGVNDAVIYAGYNATTVDNAIANAPNVIYLSPTSVTLPDTTTGAGISIVGGDGVSVTSPQVLVGTQSVPLTGDTAYFGPSYFGGMPSGVIIYSELDDVTLEAAGVINLNAPTTEVSGDLNVQGAITIQGAGIIPAGVVQSYLGTTSNVPAGWVLANGASLSTTTYADLFGVLGYRFGGSGASFNVPNMNVGYFLVGSTSSPGSSFMTGSSDSWLNATWDHTHSTDPGAFNSAASGTAQIVQSGSGQGPSAISHVHSINVPATTSSNAGPSDARRMRVVYIIKT